MAAVLAGCADRQASIDAATKLAEATYPGQLEVADAQLQKTHYDVIFAVSRHDAERSLRSVEFASARLALRADQRAKLTPRKCLTQTPESAVK
ncbi:hypothetical protein FHS54_000336 [Sphingobium vermicomposti]|uniref:Uncharacterized protein n=1 Tax=Sphingobium vermicomposti TaxID=529005 RepID=A0A846LZR9_9SPHN|nr:hypothetical protein [Sphingobium vermicomposti]